MANKKRTRILLVVLALSALALAADRTYRHFRPQQKTIYDFPRDIITARLVQIYNVELKLYNKTKWMGIKTQQIATDMWSVQEIVYEIKPDFIIETGTLFGGSALYFASILHYINPDGRVITVDIEDHADEAKKNPLFQKYVITLSGSSVDPAILSEIGRLVEGKRALVFLDSDHHKDHVLKEMRAYADFVSIGSYMIVNDTYFNNPLIYPSFGPGPMEAVQEFMKNNGSFEIDKYRARLMLSNYPDGFLKRIL